MRHVIAALLAAAACLSCGGGGPDPAPAAAVPQRAAPSVDANALLDWAERQFPTLFPGTAPNRTLGVFTYRAYANGNHVGVGSGGVFVLGPISGGELLRVGALTDFACRVRPSSCTATGTTVTGTALARSGAVVGGTVTLRDATGATRTATTGARGAYSMDVSGLAPPFVVTATTTLGNSTTTLFSVSTAGLSGSHRINLTPWTTALAAMLSPSGRAPDLSPATHATVIEQQITHVTRYSRTLLAPGLADAGESSSTYDPVSAPLDSEGAMANFYSNLTVGTTPSNAIFMADSSSRPCSPAQLGSCVRYSNPGTQTTTNPNACGSDIATGASIPCDSSLPTTATPSPIAVNPSEAYQFGCMGCVFWGPADNYTANPVQTPIRVSTVRVSTGTGNTGTGNTGGGTEVWRATFFAQVCVPGVQCVSAGTEVSGTSYSAEASCREAAAAVAAARNATAGLGVTITYTCNRVA